MTSEVRREMGGRSRLRGCLTLLVLTACGSPEPRVGADADDDWWAAAQAGIAASEYQLREVGGGALTFANRAQGLRARLAPAGSVTVTPRGDGEVLHASHDGWSVTLRTVAWGRGGALEQIEPTAAWVGDCARPDRTDAKGDCLRRAELDHGELVAWWANDERGLEQGWTIEAPPPGDGPLALAVSVDGAEVEIDAGRDGALLLTPGGARLRYGQVAAWDATGRDLPAWLEEADSLRVLVDDEGAAFPVTVDPLLTQLAWIETGDQQSAYFGSSVSTAGDVNGDGYGDIAVGASAWDGGQLNEGAAFLYLGSATGLPSTASWAVASGQADASFGESVSSAGDVNGDGYGDLVVGAYRWDGGQSNEGAAFVYLGSATGLPSSASWTAESDQAGAEFGYSVASAGDVDGDGYGDVVVGATWWDGAVSDGGGAFVYLGSASGPLASASWSAEGSQPNARLGWSVASAGDVDGDGFSDVVVGAWGWSSNTGRALVYLGSASGLETSSSWSASSMANARFGYSVAPAGDVDGDGFGDVVVGAPYWNSGQPDEGGLFVYHGSASGLQSAGMWTGQEDWSFARLGSAVSSAGDVNGDGFGDVVAGAPAWYGGDHDGGAAFVYLGSASGLQPSSSWAQDSGQPGATYGYQVSSAGDVDGDGFGDVVVGCRGWDGGLTDEGGAFVYLGSGAGLESLASWSGEPDQASASMGASVSSAGDVNGDGYDDLAVGVREWDGPNAGEVDVGG